MNTPVSISDVAAMRAQSEPYVIEHHLRSLAPFYDAVVAGKKPWEVRLNDRQFQSGDHVILNRVERQFDGTLYHTGHQHRAIIGWMLQGGQFGVEPGYCIFSLEPAAVE